MEDSGNCCGFIFTKRNVTNWRVARDGSLQNKALLLMRAVCRKERAVRLPKVQKKSRNREALRKIKRRQAATQAAPLGQGRGLHPPWPSPPFSTDPRRSPCFLSFLRLPKHTPPFLKRPRATAAPPVTPCGKVALGGSKDGSVCAKHEQL